MRRRSVRRDSIVSLAGWLFADIFLVLGIVWLGSQPFVSVKSAVHNAPKPQQSFKLALNTMPKVIDISVNARGIRAKSSTAVSKFHKALNRAGLETLQYSGALAGLVLTFAGGDDCSNHGTAELTSRAVNSLLARWYPSLVTTGTVMEAYVNFSCEEANRVKLKLYTFAN